MCLLNFVNCLDVFVCGGGVSNLSVVHSEQPLWPLADRQAGLPQLLRDVQLQHDFTDEFVPFLHAVQLLHLLPVQAPKLRVESHLDSINHILHLGSSEIKKKWLFIQSWLYYDWIEFVSVSLFLLFAFVCVLEKRCIIQKLDNPTGFMIQQFLEEVPTCSRTIWLILCSVVFRLNWSYMWGFEYPHSAEKPPGTAAFSAVLSSSPCSSSFKMDVLELFFKRCRNRQLHMRGLR